MMGALSLKAIKIMKIYQVLRWVPITWELVLFTITMLRCSATNKGATANKLGVVKSIVNALMPGLSVPTYANVKTARMA